MANTSRMGKYVYSGDSIECSYSHIAVRKLSKPSQPLRMTKLNGEEIRLFKYKCQKRGIVIIVKELVPKESVICKTSCLNIHDELEADVIEIYTPKLLNLGIISNFSHVHGIQGNAVNMFTYAKIIMPWRIFLERDLAQPPAQIA